MQNRGNHDRAAARHLEAAESHERVAAFWDERGDLERAQLQRELAEFERQGAALESRWALLVARDSAPQP